MKYKVFISTDPNLKGQCKKFKVESNLGPWDIEDLIKKVVKSNYHVIIKDGWKKCGKLDVTPFDEMLKTVAELRFYKKTYERKWVKEYKYDYKHLVLPSVITLKRWRTEDVPGYRNRTFYAITSKDPTLKPDIDGIIKRFELDCNVTMHQSKTDNIIWTFDDIEFRWCHDYDGITDYYMYEAEYEWITEETKIEI